MRFTILKYGISSEKKVGMKDDFVYFMFTVDEKKESKKMIFGTSCFRQILVTEELKKKDPELTRNSIQKAVCILSEYPMLGVLTTKMEPVTHAYFNQNDFNDREVPPFSFFLLTSPI